MANIKQFCKILSMTREGINLLKLTLCPLPTLLGLDHVWQYEVPAYPSAKAVFLQHLHKRSPEIKGHWYPQFSPLLSPLTPWLALNFSIGSCPRFMHSTLSFCVLSGLFFIAWLLMAQEMICSVLQIWFSVTTDLVECLGLVTQRK